jgi:hypothetical protein
MWVPGEESGIKEFVHWATVDCVSWAQLHTQSDSLHAIDRVLTVSRAFYLLMCQVQLFILLLRCPWIVFPRCRTGTCSVSTVTFIIIILLNNSYLCLQYSTVFEYFNDISLPLSRQADGNMVSFPVYRMFPFTILNSLSIKSWVLICFSWESTRLELLRTHQLNNGRCFVERLWVSWSLWMSCFKQILKRPCAIFYDADNVETCSLVHFLKLKSKNLSMFFSEYWM